MNYLGIEREKLNPTVQALNKLLADYHVYYQNLRNFHWNVKGHNFFELHEVFENLYNDAKVKIDEIAERILTLRFRPLSTLSDYIEIAEVEEYGKVTEPKKMVEGLLKNHKVIISDFREVINQADEITDEGTIDLIGGMLSGFEKQSWMLNSWLSKQDRPVEVES